MSLNNAHWAQIADWQQLQRLVNDLVYYEKQGTDILPSSAYVGGDDGWDGKYTGSLNGQVGIHAIQAKHHGGKPKEARAALARDLIKEIPNAVANGAQHLVLATNAELKIAQADELETTPLGGLTSITIWYRDRLRQRIEEHPALLKQYFGIGQVTYLTIPEDHFRRSESSLAVTTIREDAVSDLAQQITECTHQISIVHGVGGRGKSHLLRCATQLIAQQPNTVVRMVTGSRSHVSKDIDEDLRLAGHDQLVLVCDDIERYRADLLSELTGAVMHIKNARLIVSCRTVALQYARNQASLCGQAPTPAEFIAVALATEDLVQFVKDLAPTRCPENHIIEQAIRVYDSNPFFLKLWAQAHEKGGLEDEEIDTINRVIRDRYLASAVTACADTIVKEKVPGFLACVSAATPLSTTDSTAINAISVVTELSPSQIKNAVQKLIDGGTLRQIGSQVRFSPDTVGDLFFAHNIANAAYREAILAHILPLNPSGLASSLAAAGKRGDEGAAKCIAANILRSWAGDQRLKSPWEAKELFRCISQLSLLAPHEAMGLCRSHIEQVGHLYDRDQDSDNTALIGAMGTIDDTALVLGRHGICREEILSLYFEIAEALPDHEHKHITKTIRKLFRPLQCSLPPITEGLVHLTRGIVNGSVSSNHGCIIEAACAEVLAATHDASYSTSRTFTMRSLPLRDSPPVRTMRSAAMDVIKALLDARLYRLAIDCADSIASLTGPAPMGDAFALPLAEIFRTERRQFIDWVTDLPFEEWSLQEQWQLDELCTKWWSRKPTEDLVAAILERIPRTAQYRYFLRQAAYKAIDDFALVQSLAPDDDRANWLHNNTGIGWHRYRDQDTSNEQCLAQELAESLPSPEAIRDFLAEVTKNLDSDRKHSGNGDVSLDLWVRISAQAFRNALDLPSWESDVAPYLRRTIDASLAQSDPDLLPSLAKQVIETDGANRNTIDRFLVAAEGSRPQINTIFEALRCCCRRTEPNVRWSALMAAWRITQEDDEELVATLVREALTAGFSDELLDPISFIYECHKDTETAIPSDIWDSVLDGLVSEPKLESKWAHRFDTLIGQDPAVFTDLMDRRLHHFAGHIDNTDLREEFRVFPGLHDNWIKPDQWTKDQSIAFIEMVSKHTDLAGTYWLAGDVIQTFEVADKIIEPMAVALLECLEHSDQNVQELATSLFIESGSGSAITAESADQGCIRLLDSGLRDKAKIWLRRGYCGSFGTIDDQGVSLSLKAAISLLEKLVDITANHRAKVLYSEVLRSCLRERDYIIRNHVDDDEYMP